MNGITAQDGHVLLSVRVQPKASRNAIRCSEDGDVRVSLTAPPIDGAANEALCVFLAKRLGTAKRNVEVVAGQKSRTKTVRIKGVDVEEVRVKLLDRPGV